jgi:hypothetical protein
VGGDGDEALRGRHAVCCDESIDEFMERAVAAQCQQAPMTVLQRLRNEPMGIAGGRGGDACVRHPQPVEFGAKPRRLTPGPAAAARGIDDDEPAVGVNHRRHDA